MRQCCALIAVYFCTRGACRGSWAPRRPRASDYARLKGYAAADPLAAATLERVPKTRALKVAVGQAALLAISSTGSLRGSVDGGASWTTPELHGARQFDDVALNGRGEGLLVSRQRQVLTTEDDGRSWHVLTLAGAAVVGIEYRLSRQEFYLKRADGRLFGVLLHPWRLDGSLHQLRFQFTPLLDPERLRVSVKTYLLGQGSLELLEQGEGADHAWLLAIRRQLKDPPTLRGLPELNDCNQLVGAVFGQRFVLDCAGSGQGIHRFYASTDLGITWHEESDPAFHVIEQRWLLESPPALRSFAFDSHRQEAFSIGLVQPAIPGGVYSLALFRWRLGAATPEQLSEPLAFLSELPPV
ncbi:MAG TPA: hypothetical protein VIK01_18510, partial [Polyangiaceae bacterium]